VRCGQASDGGIGNRRADAEFQHFLDHWQEVRQRADRTQWRRIGPSNQPAAYEQVWGRSRASLYKAPNSFLEPVHPDDLNRTRQYLLRQMAQGQRLDHEYRIVEPSGAIKWILNRGFPVPDAEGRADRYVGVALDITERKELERQLTQAQKLESIGQLAAGIAHEINTPIQYIGDNSKFLEEAFGDLMGTLAGAQSGEASNGKVDVAYPREEIPKAIQQMREGVEHVGSSPYVSEERNDGRPDLRKSRYERAPRHTPDAPFQGTA
jgi:PAS domain S-box-containing protein